MKPPNPRLVVLAVAVVAFLALIPAFVLAQGPNPPFIPHPLQDRQNCLLCHQRAIRGVPHIPDDHKGYTSSDVCRDCHQSAVTEGATPAPQTAQEAGGPPHIPHSLQGRQDCTACHKPLEGSGAIGGPPVIPHTLTGRDKCLACHETGVGGTPKIPSDHAGRKDDVCQACHSAGQASGIVVAAPPSGPIPTPIAYPRVEGQDSCLDCHSTLEDSRQVEIVRQWQHSVHAERGVICADCHGGNPAATTLDDAMSPAAGYIGAPAKMEIPALCASCHADVDRMRQYDLPTDQYAKYQESIHGLKLAQGDTNVTTCYDCHGGHEILKANDPSSTVYPANVPKLCAGCHADKKLMAPYGIPTDQDDLYRQSVHGHALIDNQDFRAPTCATCHGTHGAAPPGFNEVANVCGSCHSATQDYYVKSAHATVEGGPKCVTCHGRYDVRKPSEALFLGDEPRHCGECHPYDSPIGSQITQTHNYIDNAAKAYDEAEVSIQAARKLGMLVAPQENLLREANTQLVTARAAQHELALDKVYELTKKASENAKAATEQAKAAVGESVSRRVAMVIAVVAISLVILALYLYKRELDRRLQAEEQA